MTDVSNDPLACFVPSKSSTEGVLVDVEHPTTGEVLMRFQVRRFGGPQNAEIIRVERGLKAKLPQGQRRAIENGVGDPDIVQRLNRATFARVAVLGFEAVNPALKERYPTYSTETVDKLFEEYPMLYDLVTGLATDEDTFARDTLEDDVKN